ncbi:MAG: hypothetical protein NC339_01380 [Muribaculaceae bacterium]|nr:hypothetical protein [Muribaculaceae bacterium]
MKNLPNIFLALFAIIFIINLVMWILGQMHTFSFIINAVAFVAYIGLYCSTPRKS